MKQATLDGFKKIKTLVESLDEKGNIKPKLQIGGNQQHTGRVITKDEAEATRKMLAETNKKIAEQGKWGGELDWETINKQAEEGKKEK